MTEAAIDFEWWVDEEGYDLVRNPSPQAADVHEPFLRPKSGRRRAIRPLDFNPALYGQFCALGDDPEACQRFANRFGLLGVHQPEAVPASGESLRTWLGKITELRAAVEGWQSQGLAFLESTTGWEIAGPKAYVRRRSLDGEPEMVLRPQSLYEALKVQFARAILSPSDIYACECCGKPFSRGGGARRRDARFCCDLCRTRFNRNQCSRVMDPFAGSGGFLVTSPPFEVSQRSPAPEGQVYLTPDVAYILRKNIPGIDERSLATIIGLLPQLQRTKGRGRGKKPKR